MVMLETIKRAVEAILPARLARAIRSYLVERRFRQFDGLPTDQLFSKVYSSGVWGKSGDAFFSGAGSRDSAVLDYIVAVEGFLKSLDRKPDVVDLGCGDFFVGSQIRPLCAGYTACDIVPALIAFNKQKFGDLDVDFRALNIVTDDLPDGDVAIVRQVLQHLSHQQIASALQKISAKYMYLILTEHLPRRGDFRPNVDQAAGPGIRARVKSGVVITAPPFNFKAKDTRRLCEMDEAGETGGLIVTTLYTLA